MKQIKHITWIILVILLTLQTLGSPAKVFEGISLQAKDTKDKDWPVVGIEDKKPLILTDSGIIRTERGFLRVRPTQRISDQGIEIIAMEEVWRENALLLDLQVKASEPMEGVYAVLPYPREGKPVPGSKYTNLPSLSGEVQSFKLRFNRNGIPDTGWSVHFFKGNQELYSNRSENLREATPQEAFKLQLARHLTAVGTGDANPAPFYMPIPKLPDSLRPAGDEAVMIKVKLTVKASGKVADYSFPADLSDEIEEHLRSSIKGWLILPRIKDGKAVDQEVVLPIELH